jgi:hypothetical protein
MYEEPTVAEEEREAAARQSMARALAEHVRSALPLASVLVVARGPGVPTGVLVSEDPQLQSRELDGVVLAEILSGAHDDRVAVALTRLVLGDSDVVEHAVARDPAGNVVGVIAVRTASRVSSTWLRTVLARAANSIAAWLAFDVAWPPQTLLEAIEEPALAHDGGIVLVANTALAHALGREPSELIGMPAARIMQRLMPLRTCSLVVGGRPRNAIIFAERETPPVETSVLACLDRVIAERYALVRQTTRISVERRDGSTIMAHGPEVEELVTLALLDTVATFTTSSPANHVRCSVVREQPWVVLEMVATGTLANGPDLEHLGSVICASRVRALGGQFFLDSSRVETRVLRITLPIEA